LQNLFAGVLVTPAKRAAGLVDQVYPALASGLPHHVTRKKQRIAWQLGYLKGYEEARRKQIHEHLEDK
jgi:hypothetical protein